MHVLIVMLALYWGQAQAALASPLPSTELGSLPTPASATFWSGFAEGFANGYGGVASSQSGQVASGTINGSFEGFAHGRVYVLRSGQVWQQTEYYTWFWYAYSPSVLIYRDGATYRMLVDGIDQPVAVVRLR